MGINGRNFVDPVTGERNAMPKINKPRSKYVEPKITMAPVVKFKVGDRVTFDNGTEVYEVISLPVMASNPWYKLSMDGKEYNAPGHLLNSANVDEEKQPQADIDAMRETREEDGRQVPYPAPVVQAEPEWVAKLITWDKANRVGFIRLATPDACDMYMVREEGQLIATWTKLVAHQHGLNIVSPYRTTISDKPSGCACTCDGWRRHGKCKHVRATLALINNKSI